MHFRGRVNGLYDWLLTERQGQNGQVWSELVSERMGRRDLKKGRTATLSWIVLQRKAKTQGGSCMEKQTKTMIVGASCSHADGMFQEREGMAMETGMYAKLWSQRGGGMGYAKLQVHKVGLAEGRCYSRRSLWKSADTLPSVLSFSSPASSSSWCSTTAFSHSLIGKEVSPVTCIP